jgi:cysteine desulfurase
MGWAAELALEQQTSRELALRGLEHTLSKGFSKIDGVLLTGHPQQRLPGHVSACFDLVEGEALVRLLGQSGIAAASGSACSDFTVSSKASHVLTALGIEATRAQGSVVCSLGRETTEEEIGEVLRLVPATVERLRRLSPLYRPPS